MAKDWKSVEERIETWLNEQGFPWVAKRMSRLAYGTAVEDVCWGDLASVEVKSRAGFPPGYLLQWMAQAKANCKGKVPLVVIHKDRMHMGKQVVVLTLDDLMTLLRKAREEAAHAGNESESPEKSGT